MVTSEEGDRARDGDYPDRFRRAASTTSSAGGSVDSGVCFDPEGRDPSSQELADAPAIVDWTPYDPDQQSAALSAGEAKRLAENITEPRCTTIFKGRTCAEEKRLKAAARTGLVSVEDDLDIAPYVEKETLLEQALHGVDVEVSVEMPTEKIQDLPSPTTTEEEEGVGTPLSFKSMYIRIIRYDSSPEMDITIVEHLLTPVASRGSGAEYVEPGAKRAVFDGHASETGTASSMNNTISRTTPRPATKTRRYHQKKSSAVKTEKPYVILCL